MRSGFGLVMNVYAVCGHCEHRNYTSARFCGQCGRSLLRTCHACQGQVQASDIHCQHCGGKLQPLTSAPADPDNSDDIAVTGEYLERRQVTVQFCDLCGSTDLSDQLDPEDLVRILRLYQDGCTRILKAHDGFISQYLGDGIVTLFGFPTTNDDTAYRAVVSGLEIIEHFQTNPAMIDGSLNTLSVRIGVATGMVLAGDLIGTGHSAEQPVVGQTPNLAARLQSVAKENTIVISERTHRLVNRQITCKRFGPLSLKGIGKPVFAYRALQPMRTVQIDTTELGRDGSNRFVNRVAEMAQLNRAWHESRNSHGQAVLITAEPGMGKTRLWQEFARRLEPDEHLLIPLQCSSNASNTPLHPLSELLIDESTSWPEKLVRTLKSSVTAEQTTTLTATLNELTESLKQMNAGSGAAQSVHKHPGEQFIDLVAVLSDYIPVLLCLEDVHWADPTTMTMVTRLSRNIGGRRVCCVLLARPHVRLTPWKPDLVIEFERLNQNDVRQIVNNQVSIDTVPAALLDVILSKSEGVPLFIEEITNSLLDHQFNTMDGDISDPEVTTDFAVPDTLRDLLMARLDSLGEAKRIAQFASVIGREFTLSSIAKLSSMQPERLLDWIHGLLASGLVQFQNSAAEQSYQFKHALIQDAAYESITRAQKKRLHAKMAQLLQDTIEEDALNAPELIASHYQAAGQHREAATAWNTAAGNALRLSANREAFHHAKQGINLLARLDECSERDHLSLSLHIYLSSAIAGTRGDATPELEDIHAKASELIQRVNDDTLTFSLTREMHAFYLIRGPVERACELGRTLLSLAETSEQPQNRLDSLRVLGWTYFCHGQLAEGRDLLKMSTIVYRKADSRLHTQHDTIDPGAVGLINLAWAETLMANHAQAEKLIKRSTDLAVEIEHPYSLTYTLCMGSAVHQCRNEPDKALLLVDQALEIATKNEFQYFIAWGNALRGWVLAKNNQSEEGLKLLLSGQRQYEATGARLFMPYILSLHADALLHNQSIEKAHDLLERAMIIAEDNGIHFFSSETLRMLAVAKRELGNSKEASRLFDKAAKLAAEQGAIEFAERVSIDQDDSEKMPN